MDFLRELKRRNVYKVAVTYAVVAWLVIQAASILFPTFDAPAWLMKALVALLAVGFALALLLAWAFEMTPQGMKRTEELSPDEVLPYWSRRKFAAVIASIALLALALFVFQRVGGDWIRRARGPGSPALEVSAKSIAVLPFLNMSNDKANAYFADGVQEEILTTLAKVADLKVISRTSVMQFRDAGKRNVREIAQQLGVAHVLEGSVQRAADRVRVTAQLIDARTDAHLWADRYDRELSDVFAIQSEIAQKIAQQLQAALSPTEKAALQTKPTADLVAYDLYLKAREFDQNFFTAETPARLEQLTRLLDEAVARDPEFVPALCLLARAHLAAYWFNVDPSPTRVEKARRALEAAARVRADDGDVHVTRAYLHYWGARDYEAALAETDLARRKLPNDTSVLVLTGAIERRQAHWAESTRHLNEAMELDPRNVRIPSMLRTNHFWMRHYDQGVRVLEKILTWKPGDFAVLNSIGDARVFGSADLNSKVELLASESANAAEREPVAIARLELALLQRDYPAARAALDAFAPAELNLSGGFVTPREWFDGLIAVGLGEPAQARIAFEAARQRAAATLARRNDDSRAVIVLAEIDARLGNREDALRGGEQAMRLLPVSKDAIDGPIILTRFANIQAQLGNVPGALDLLEQATRIPNGEASYGELKLDAKWDSLRKESRFQQILASLAP